MKQLISKATGRFEENHSPCDELIEQRNCLLQRKSLEMGAGAAFRRGDASKLLRLMIHLELI
jgi:hypothetical protein